MGVVDVVKRHVALEPFRMFMLPRAADDRLEPGRVRAANGVVNGNDAAAALEKFFEVVAIRAGDGTGFGREHHQHVGLLQLLTRGKLSCAIDRRAALGEKLLPLGHPLLVLVQTVAGGPVRLRSAPQENAQWLLRERRSGHKEAQCRQEETSKCHVTDCRTTPGCAKPKLAAKASARLADVPSTGRKPGA